MEIRSVVVAFADSPVVRETLAVILERDCTLEFRSAQTAAPVDWTPPDVAVVTDVSLPLLHDLTSRFPALPIVAVGVPPGLLPGGKASGRQLTLPPGVQAVPFHPQAIRTAVLRGPAGPADAALRAGVRRVVETLQSELHYSFNALRSFATLPGNHAGPDAYPILGAVVSEQCHALGEVAEHLQVFLDRPRQVTLSPDFAAAVSRQLAQPPQRSGERGVQYERDGETLLAVPKGPLTLAPVIAGFLRAHVRRRADPPVARMQLTARGLAVRYGLRPVASTGSWPLLLASLALQPWSWSVSASQRGSEETVHLHASGSPPA